MDRMPTAALANRLNWSAYRDLPVEPFSLEGATMGAPQPTIHSFFQPRKKAKT